MLLPVLSVLMLYVGATVGWRHCDYDSYTPVGYAAGAHYRAGRSLLPIQQAAASILGELQTGDLLPEMVEPVASFALALVAVHDAFVGQCAHHETRDAVSHKLCAAYVNHERGLQAACAGRLQANGALACTCADLRGGIVGICNAQVAISAHDVPLCYRAQEAGCRSAIWGLCDEVDRTTSVVRPAKRIGAHRRHNTKPMHTSLAAHANAQQAGRWAHRAKQRLQAATTRGVVPHATTGGTDTGALRRVATVGLPQPQVLAFLFLLSSHLTLNKLVAGRPGSPKLSQPVVCTMWAEAGAAAELVLAVSNVVLRGAGESPRAGAVGLLMAGSCDALALWWGHAETVYTNPCDHGAGHHPRCTKGTLLAFAVGHRLLKDPQGQSVVTTPPHVQAMLAAQAEHHEHLTWACRYALQKSPHHHLPHC
jgi:hypothetical protein